MEALQSLPPIVALVLGFVLLAWLVLAALVPFMVESIRQSTRKTHQELALLNDKLERLNATLIRNAGPPDRPQWPGAAAGRQPESRERREPTISEMDFEHAQGERHEPIVK